MKRKIRDEVIYRSLDNLYRKFDKIHIRRTRNIRLIPGYVNRKGGKLSYAEWAHVIGIFQTIIYQTFEGQGNKDVLDVGCGTGLLGIAAEPMTSPKGSYLGIDVMKYDIDFCRKHFKNGNYRFIHFDVANPTYAATQDENLKPWPIEDESRDLITALSVWTHLREEHAIYYFKEVARVLKKGGKAIITFFYLDESYEASLPLRSDTTGRYHSTNQLNWIFDESAYGSKNWFTPKWTKAPEDATGISKEALNTLLAESGLKLVKYYPGNWKETPGVFFQDILIFEK